MYVWISIKLSAHGVFLTKNPRNFGLMANGTHSSSEKHIFGPICNVPKLPGMGRGDG